MPAATSPVLGPEGDPGGPRCSPGRPGPPRRPPSRIDEFLELDAPAPGAAAGASRRSARRRTRPASGSASCSASGEDASEAIAEVKELGDREKELDARAARGRGARGTRCSRRCRTRRTPSAPDEDTVLREVGEAGASGPDHLELLGDLIDLEAGARVAGSRFAYLKGSLVLLELALVRWALEVLREKGFVPVVPPVLVREEAMYGTGFFPAPTCSRSTRVPEEEKDDLFLVGTSEVPLAAFHMNEILDADELPLRYAGRELLLPAGGGHGRQGHTRSSACTSSTRSRCSRSSRADRLARRARTSSSSARRRSSSGARYPLPRARHRRR